MARERHQISLDFPDIERDAPRCLGGIGMKGSTGFLGDSPQRSKVLDHADFIIHRHDGNEQGGFIAGGAQHFGIKQPIGADRQDAGLKPLLRQVTHGFEHAFMFSRDRDDAPAGIALARGKARGAFDGEVICLGRA